MYFDSQGQIGQPWRHSVAASPAGANIFIALLASTWLVHLAWGVAPMLWRDAWCCVVLALGWNWWRSAPLGRRASVFANALLLAAVANAGNGLWQWVLQLQHPLPGAAGYVQGFMHQRNHLASLLVMGLLALACVPPHWRTKGIGLAVEVTAVALMGAALSLSGSRTGGLMLLCWWVMLEARAMFWRSEGFTYRARLLARIAICTYVAITVAPSLLGAQTGFGMFARVVEGGAGCQSRLILWSNVLHLTAQKPWLGWGWGELDYAHFVARYPGDRFCDILDNAHNLPLHLAVELGVPVAAVVCSVCAWLVWRNRPWAEKNPARQLAWGLLVVIGFHSLLEYPLWYGPFQLAAVMAIGLLCAHPARGTSHSVKRSPAFGPHSLIPALLMALCAYIAWDYYRISQIYLQPGDRSPAYRTNTLQKIQGTWLFANHVAFAELTLTPVTPQSAARIHVLAHRALHFSPEARVVEKLIDSALLLGKPDEVEYFRIRYKEVYPDKFERWAQQR